MERQAYPVAEKCDQCEYRSIRQFCNLNDSALQQFDKSGVHISFPGRAVVFEEGKRADRIFVVCSGRLKLSTTSRDGKTMILRLAGPGDVLGLSAIMSNLPYEVTAETIEPTRLKTMQNDDFLTFLQTHNDVGRKTAVSLANEYREVFHDARRLALSGSAAGRLGQLLLDWARTAVCGKPELRFTMALTHEELANMAGTSRETVTRLLSQFERDRLIIRRGSSLTIIDAAGLEQLVQ